MGLKRGKIDGKGGVEEKFSIWHFRGKKVQKAPLSAYGGYAAGLARERTFSPFQSSLYYPFNRASIQKDCQEDASQIPQAPQFCKGAASLRSWRKCEAPLRRFFFSQKCGVKRPALSWGRGGDASPHKSGVVARATPTGRCEPLQGGALCNQSRKMCYTSSMV